MHQFGIAARLEEVICVYGVSCNLLFFNIIQEAAEITYRCIEPHIKEFFAIGAGNRKAEVGCVARNIPIRKS